MKRLFVILAAALAIGNLQAHVWDELAIMARPNDKGNWDLDKYCFIQPSTYTNAVFFDYNNDGNLDLLLMGRGGDWNYPGTERFVLLYRNLGADEDFRFEIVTDTTFRQAADEGFFSPLSVGDFNHDGYTDVALMSYDNGRNIEIYLNENGSGKFRLFETIVEGAANGSVSFADIDNDGWLDLEFSGFTDNKEAVLRLYHNDRGNSLTDISDPMLGGAYQGESTLADMNGDGWLDILSCGIDASHTHVSSIYLRTPENGGWRYVSEEESHLKGAAYANPLVADFNNDGIMDIVLNGEAADGSGFRVRIYYGVGDGTYLPDTSFPIVAINQDGGTNMGDWNGDGNMDIIVGGYLGQNDSEERIYSSPLRVYENTPSDMGLNDNTFPEPPVSVKAIYENGLIKVSWQPGQDKESPIEALRYNIAVVNKTTGETYTLIPSDIDTGHLKVGTDLQTSLSSVITHYELTPFGDGEYEVGVQTLDQAYAGSKFNFSPLSVEGSGVSFVEDESGVNVSRIGKRINISSSADLRVNIYTLSGAIVASGSQGEYELDSGFYLVRTAQETNVAKPIAAPTRTFKIMIP